MKKTLIAGLTAFSLALTPAAPAQALSDEEVGQILFGLVALGVLGAAIKNNRSQQAAPAHQPQVSRNPPAFHAPAPRHQPRADPAVLPGRCLDRVLTHDGPRRIFGGRCLNRTYDHVANLPGQCRVRLHTSEGPRRGYDAFCLRNHGYRSDRGH